jgi:hypothetical protein
MDGFALSAIPDTVDFRDRMFDPTLIDVKPTLPLEKYLDDMGDGLAVLDQGREGACTGFALAAVANHLLWTGGRYRDGDGRADRVSPWMLYAMAKRYDEWEGEDYEGSSARGAMKAWHKHGVCSEEHWCRGGERDQDRALWPRRWEEALRRPLGAYYRVNHKDLVAMHAAITEVGSLYATGSVHGGWSGNAVSDGIIDYDPQTTGGHAFAIVGYDGDGFWIQNSWGEDWGRDGFARLSYDDWMENGVDVWVGRLGAPVHLARRSSTAAAGAPGADRSRGSAFSDLRPHIVSLGNDGSPRATGTYGTDTDGIQRIFGDDLPAFVESRAGAGGPVHVLLYAHGGLVAEEAAVQRLADLRAPLLDNGVFPVSFIWKTDYWTTTTNILRDAVSRRRQEGFLDEAKDFLLDRLDDGLEPIARRLTGKAQWDEMKENALMATTRGDGGARVAARALEDALGDRIRGGEVRLHVVGHSAGSIFMAPLVRLLAEQKGASVSFTDLPEAKHTRASTGLGLPISSCTLWAPACTVELFARAYAPLVETGAVEQFALFTLTDKAEQDDHCANIYHKSLLYLVSNAFEAEPRIPVIRDRGVPILGMEAFVGRPIEEWSHDVLSELEERSLAELMDRWGAEWIRSPNDAPDGSPGASRSHTHGGFDDDDHTLKATLVRILACGLDEPVEARDLAPTEFHFARSESSNRARRRALEEQTRAI